MFEQSLYFNLNAVTRRINRIWDDAFADMEISPAHAYLLRLVLRSQPGLSPKQISDQLQLKKSTVTRFIDALEKREFLSRSQGSETDARLISIHPTRRARAIQAELEQRGEHLHQRLCITLGAQHVAELTQTSRATLRKL